MHKYERQIKIQMNEKQQVNESNTYERQKKQITNR